MICLFNVLKCPVNVRQLLYKSIEIKAFAQKRTYRTWLNVRNEIVNNLLKWPLYYLYIIIYQLIINNTIGHIKDIKRTKADKSGHYEK